MYHIARIFVNIILHLGAWSPTIYLRGLHIDLHEDQSLYQLNQSYCSSYGTFCCIESAHAQQYLFCYPSNTIRFSNMIITYNSINTIMIMQPILQLAMQSLCLLNQLFQQGWNLNGKLILSWPSLSNFFKNWLQSAVSTKYSSAMMSKYILDCPSHKLGI